MISSVVGNVFGGVVGNVFGGIMKSSSSSGMV